MQDAHAGSLKLCMVLLPVMLVCAHCHPNNNLLSEELMLGDYSACLFMGISVLHTVV